MVLWCRCRRHHSIVHVIISCHRAIFANSHRFWRIFFFKVSTFQMPHAGSLWARLRLSGRKAARWRFQLAVTSCTLELGGRTLKRPPHRLSLLVTRKKRKAHSAQFKWHCSQPSRPSHVHLVVGTNQEPIDFQSTLNTKTTLDNVSLIYFEQNLTYSGRIRG